mmetsp:Transcript_29876/g.79498  ORF Transcript_29876/g.79498 Transcript_29876/m.79498 type:complete len:255 (+) Transcript_29876:440-1204(+)
MYCCGVPRNSRCIAITIRSTSSLDSSCPSTRQGLQIVQYRCALLCLMIDGVCLHLAVACLHLDCFSCLLTSLTISFPLSALDVESLVHALQPRAEWLRRSRRTQRHEICERLSQTLLFAKKGLIRLHHTQQRLTRRRSIVVEFLLPSARCVTAYLFLETGLVAALLTHERVTTAKCRGYVAEPFARVVHLCHHRLFHAAGLPSHLVHSSSTSIWVIKASPQRGFGRDVQTRVMQREGADAWQNHHTRPQRHGLH